MTLPVLRTPRLSLRPRTLADLDACLAMDREPGTLDWIGWPEEAGGWGDEAAHRAFIRHRILGPYPAGMGYWIVARRDEPDRFLGWVMLIPEDARGPEVEIGWRLLTAGRGQGYATEAAGGLLRHGLDTLGLPRIIADIRPGNVASRRVALKIGMRETGSAPGGAHLLRFEAQSGA